MLSDERSAYNSKWHLTYMSSVMMQIPDPYHEFLVSCCYVRDYRF